MCNGTRNGADAGASRRTHQNRAADHGGDDGTARRTERAAREDALLVTGHVLAACERDDQQGGGGKTG